MPDTKASNARVEQIRGLVFDATPIPMVVLDGKGRVVLANEATLHIFEEFGHALAPGDVLSEQHAAFDNAAGERLQAFIASIGKDPEAAHASFEVDLDGDRHVEIVTRPVALDSDPDTTYVLVTVHDVSGHVRSERASEEAAVASLEAERRARAQAQQLSLQADIIELSHDAIFILDTAGLITFWSRGAERTYGWTSAEALGKTPSSLLGSRFVDSSRHDAEQLLQTRGSWEGLILHTTRDGRELVMSSRWALHEQAHGAEILEINSDITAEAESIAQTQDAKVELEDRVAEVEKYNRQITTLGEMGELMQSCPTTEEAFEVAQRYIPRLFDEKQGGAVYVIESAEDSVAPCARRVVAWGDCERGAAEFELEDCWGLRMSRVHTYQDSEHDLRCKHVRDDHPPYVCIPMIAQGESLGLVHVAAPSEDAFEDERWFNVLRGIAEQLSVTIANLRLRENLETLSVEDPLTGLYNRRFMEAGFQRELARAKRYDESVSVLMIDIDDFKQLNDSQGHRAGDEVLHDVGGTLRRLTREVDIVARYGGEEFFVVLPSAGPKECLMRANAIREALAEGPLGGQAPGTVRVSIGCAAYPEHGASAEELIQAADQALYRAKRAGKDRAELSEAPASRQ